MGAIEAYPLPLSCEISLLAEWWRFREEHETYSFHSYVLAVASSLDLVRVRSDVALYVLYCK